MNNRVVYNLHYAFHALGFTVLRFNFRGVGRSQGEYDQGIGELSDAASALDYLQAMNTNAKHCWVAGFSFGAWIGMQLLMRRPEITGSSRSRRPPTCTTSRSWRPARPRASSSTARPTGWRRPRTR
jgi:alpha/beta superfamily hydrolase